LGLFKKKGARCVRKEKHQKIVSAKEGYGGMVVMGWATGQGDQANDTKTNWLLAKNDLTQSGCGGEWMESVESG